MSIKIKKILLSVITSCLSVFSIHASTISDVDVTSMGFGTSEGQAIQDALVNAIAQVNGEAIVASSQLRETSTTKASSDGSSSRDIQREIAEEINRKTRGVLKSWRIAKVEKTEGGDYSATVNAKIVVLQRSQQLERLKIAVVVPRQSEQPFSDQLANGITRELTTSRKFAVLDRKNTEVIQQQLNRIRQGGGQIADQVRLISEVAPDVLVVIRVETADRPDGRKSAFGNVEIIDYSTRQVKFSDRKPMILDLSNASSTVNRMNVLSRAISRSILEAAYPPTVVGQAGESITIAQGSDYFSNGDVIDIFYLGKEIRDPHTGEFLSYERELLGDARISYTDTRISQAKLNKQIAIDPVRLAQKKIVVSKKSGGSGSVQRSATGASNKSRVSTLLDEEE
jgi:hypothetical protein